MGTCIRSIKISARVGILGPPPEEIGSGPGAPDPPPPAPKTGPQIPQGEPGDPVPSTSLPPRDRGRSRRPSKAQTTAPIRHAAAAPGAPEEPPRHGARPHHTPARRSRPAPIHRVRGRGCLPCRRRRPGFARPRPGAAGEERERWGGRRLAAARVFPSRRHAGTRGGDERGNPKGSLFFVVFWPLFHTYISSTRT